MHYKQTTSQPRSHIFQYTGGIEYNNRGRGQGRCRGQYIQWRGHGPTVSPLATCQPDLSRLFCSPTESRSNVNVNVLYSASAMRTFRVYIIDWRWASSKNLFVAASQTVRFASSPSFSHASLLARLPRRRAARRGPFTVSWASFR